LLIVIIMPKKDNALIKDTLHVLVDTGPQTTGHKIDFGTYTEENGLYRAWITKLNKEGNPNNSVLEVVFSQIATLFIKPGLTPPVKIVLEEGNTVYGVASENYSVQIKKMMLEGTTCYSFDPETWESTPISIQEASITEKEKEEVREKLKKRLGGVEPTTKTIRENATLKKTGKGVHFLADMGIDFFSTLMQKHTSGAVVVDMESLASIFTASYALEEDDLHKGNIGFYVTETLDNKGQVKNKFSFFKIDHDLMFIDSIMSRMKVARAALAFYNEDSFKITVRDLEGFPDLKDSGNHYWPTKWRLMAKGDKQYAKFHDRKENKAFAGLKNDPEFTAAKWNYFLKYSLIPTSLVKESLVMHLDPTNADDKTKIVIIQNSVDTRMKQLKQALLNSPKFIDYLRTDRGKASKEGIKKEIEAYLKTSGIEKEKQAEILKEIDTKFNLFVVCAEARKTSQLTKTIMLDCYDFISKVKPAVKDLSLAKYKFHQYEAAARGSDIALIQAEKLAKEAAKEAEEAAVKDPFAAKDILAAKFVIDDLTAKAVKAAEVVKAAKAAKDDNAAHAFKYACIVIDLIEKSDYKKDDKNVTKIKELMQNYKQFFLQPVPITTFEAFTKAADKIRAADLPLKNQKNEIIELLKTAKLNKPDLLKLKDELNKKEPSDTSLKFIKQLRSEYWFIRKWRGLYGNTYTSDLMIKMIDAQIKTKVLDVGVVDVCKNKSQNYRERTFFESGKKNVQPDDEPADDTLRGTRSP
jgi:hypothetical protein